ncbi:lipase 1 [Cladorrhinum sp. PSN332]|nr:lipase 1 [Cladorrhinum sp. PSN332]
MLPSIFLLPFLVVTSASVFKPPDQKPIFASSHLHQKVTGFTSLGDSYSAGIGTPPTQGDNPCRLGTGAYPYLLARSLDLSPLSSSSSSPTFQWLSCTGSTTADLFVTSPYSQISAINTTLGPPSFATLSIGGNDLDFFALLNACVFRFYGPFGSGTCADSLRKAEDAIFQDSDEFELRLRLVLLEVLDRMRWERRPDFFVTVTGYAAFFNAETKKCDGVTFGVWNGEGGGGIKLTKEVRRRMNELVRGANEILRGVVETVSEGFGGKRKAVFVDYDGEFEGHRFCEEGVEEPDYERAATWFFLPGGKDTNGKGEVYEEEEKVIGEGDKLVDPWECEEVVEESGDWGERAVCDMVRAKWRDPELRFVSGHERLRVAPGDSMWFTPTYYGKTFHPRSVGHEAIRDKIYNVWEEHGLLK